MVLLSTVAASDGVWKLVIMSTIDLFVPVMPANNPIAMSIILRMSTL